MARWPDDRRRPAAIQHNNRAEASLAETGTAPVRGDRLRLK